MSPPHPDRSPLPPLALWMIAVLPVVGFGAAFLYSERSFDGYLSLTREDGPLETMQVVFFAIAMAFAAHLAWRLLAARERLHGWLYAILAVGLFFVAGEEISWGQRIWGVATPEWYASVNSQGETNLHNLKGVGRILELLLNNTLFTVAVVSCACWWWRPLRSQRWTWRWYLYVPHPALATAWLLFVPQTVLSAWLKSRQADPSAYNLQASRMQEVSETFLAAAGAAFLWMVWIQLRQARRRAAGAPERQPNIATKTQTPVETGCAY